MADTTKTNKGGVVEVAAQLDTIADDMRELAQRLRGVKGTRELSGTKTSQLVRNPIDPELYNRVRKMLETEPMRLAQIVETTGQTDNKIKAVITKLQREGVKVVNLGAANKALWFIPTTKALARLEGATDED